MMAEYINREKLPPKKEREFFWDDDFNAGWNACLNKINSIPAADVVERMAGKWINYLEDGFVECPFCHCATNCDGDISELHYCFNCGDKLEGDEDV